MPEFPQEINERVWAYIQVDVHVSPDGRILNASVKQKDFRVVNEKRDKEAERRKRAELEERGLYNGQPIEVWVDLPEIDVEAVVLAPLMKLLKSWRFDPSNDATNESLHFKLTRTGLIPV